MKKLLFGFFLMFLSVATFAQQGLDGIIVEKYYVANAADHAADPNLAVGAITYRIYVDMKAGWQLQSVYSDATKTQRLQFATTAPSFYNETSNGSNYASSIVYTGLKTGTVMLDSWITMGNAAKKAGTNNYYGTPKADDDAVATIAHTDGLIQGTDPAAGTPVKDRDGYINVATAVSIVPASAGITDLEDMLDGTTSVNSVTINDGLYFTTSICQGPDAVTNKVLIGQFTTEGVFNFRFQLQIRRISDFVVENYVSENPGTGQFLRADLAQTLGTLPTPPTVTGLTVNPASVIVGAVVNMYVTATDNVSVNKVEFFRNTTSIGVSPSTSTPFTLAYTTNTVGSFNITAVATDDEGTTATSTPVSLTVTGVPANIAPVVNTLTSDSTTYKMNLSVVNVIANATDADGTVANVKFYVNNVLHTTVPGAGPSFAFNYTPTAEGSLQIKAVATDNQGGVSADKIVNVTVVNPAGEPYVIKSDVVSCLYSDIFTIPVITRPGSTPRADIIGFDMVMRYDANLVKPTGIIKVNNDLVAENYKTTALRVEGDSLIYITLFLNTSAPTGTTFNGLGQVLAVEFARTTNFAPNQTAKFSMKEFTESYNTGILPKAVTAGTFQTFSEKEFKGYLKFWSDNSPIYYTGSPATSLITNIWDVTTHTVAVQPDMNGMFKYDITKGLGIQIIRDINKDTSIMSVVNGYDAYLTQKVVLEDPSFQPNVFQMIAMDVNQDGKISAGDVTQINQRTVLKIKEFKQIWNYNNQGAKILANDSWDWTFVDNKTVLENLAYRKSATYPKDDLTGYSRNRVPAPLTSSFNLPVEYPITGYDCPSIGSETYQGVMLGDVNGSYKNLAKFTRPGVKSLELGKGEETKAEAKGIDKVIFDLSSAKLFGNTFSFPVIISSEKDVNSLDFEMKFDSKLKFKEAITSNNSIQSVAYYNENDQTLRFTSFSMANYPKGSSIVTVTFELKNGTIELDDLKSIKAYLNGDAVLVEISKLLVSENRMDSYKIYPNPTNSILNVELPEDANIEILDMNGKVIRIITDLIGQQRYVINVESYPKGAYLIRIYNDVFSTTKRFVVTK